MGKITGFLEIRARAAGAAAGRGAAERLARARGQAPRGASCRTQGARCMDCGVPFCHKGCPLGNIIPDWNDLVYRGRWKDAIDRLHATNNFPEFTGRVCPAPCEEACVLGINDDAGHHQADREADHRARLQRGLGQPQSRQQRTGKQVAVVGSGPAGLALRAAAQARRPHWSTVFERADRIGGLLRYGIPDFKLEKHLVDRRMEQMAAEGVKFHAERQRRRRRPGGPSCASEFDAIVLAGGATQPRDLPIPGRELQRHPLRDGVPAAAEPARGGRRGPRTRSCAAGKHVIILGGGDTGSDCLGTSNRHGALSRAPVRAAAAAARRRGPRTSRPGPTGR